MARTTAEIVALYRERKNALGPVRAKAAEISRVYEGEVTIPLPELNMNERAAVANWLTQGLDQMAMRVASVTPNVQCPPTRMGFSGSENKAKTRRRAITAWWQENHLDLQMSKRARWLIGYASAPAVVRPDSRRGIPVWELRDPLSTYPAPVADPVGICPPDCIFAINRSWRWIAKKYPSAARALDPSKSPNPDRLFECLEYIDDDEHVLVALGNPETAKSTQNWPGQRSAPQGATMVELARFPNRVGRCTAIVPKRISLNNAQGQFDQMPSLYAMQARALALWIVASERTIFPDTWFVSRPNEQVSILQLPDGRGGVPGMVRGGDLKEVAAVSPPQIPELIEMIEQNQMKTAGVSPQFGGQGPSTLRTGRAMESNLSSTVDFWVQEAQRVLGYAITEENKLAVAVAREYFGDQKKTFFVTFGKTNGAVDYTPNVDFDSDANIVSWPHAGSDANQLSIEIGQLLGLQVISKRTSREKHPLVDDPDLEEDRVTAEAMEQAMMMAIGQAAEMGQIGPLEIGTMVQMIEEERKTVYEAYQSVHEKIQAQAQAAQQGMGAGMGPGGGGPPGAGAPAGGGAPGAPGLAAPGVAAQLGLPAAGNAPGGGPTAPTPGVAHASQLLKMLKGGGAPGGQ